MSDELTKAIEEIKRDEALDMVKRRSEAGEDPLQILDECRHGLTLVGDKFQTGEYFLSELLMSAEIMKGAAAILAPYLAKSLPPNPVGKVVVATLQGDIHDLGKNLFVLLLRAQGFEVHDLGVDVPPALLVEKVKEVKPDIVGFSVLITSTFGSMKEAAEMLEKAGLRNQFKLIVGGGISNPMVKDFIRADFQTTDAMAGVAYCIKSIGAQHG